MKAKRFLALSLAVASLFAFAACGKEESNKGDKDVITWWIANQAAPIVKSYDEISAIQELQEKFGVDIEFVHPSTEQSSEQFNIMAASGDFKDIVTHNWNAYTGGPVKAAKDGAIIVLDDYIEKNMPNLSKMMAEDPSMNYLVRCYDGSVCVIPGYTDNNITRAIFGPMIRKDWLDKLGLEIPETMEDWYTVLKAFKTQDPNGNGIADEIPFETDGTATFMRFSRAYNGTDDEFFVDGNGKVKFGFIEPEYKEYLREMNKWYEEGLIEPEYAALNSATFDTKMVSNIGGSFIGYSGSSMSKYIAAARAENPDYKLVATQWPTKDGGAPYCGYPYQKGGVPGSGIAVAKTNKNVEKTLEIIDYLYSEEGSILFSWGIEGVTYENTDNGKKFTDYVLKNPENKSPIEAISTYALTQYPLGLSNSEAFVALNTAFDEQRDAMELWNKSDLSRIIPSLTISPEEQAEITKVMDDIYMYRREWIHKFVMGVVPIEKWDEVAAEIRDMGIDKAIAVYQKAYDRYVNQ